MKVDLAPLSLRNTQMRTSLSILAVAVLLVSATTFAQEERRRGRPRPSEQKPAAEPQKKDAPKKDEKVTAIVGGDIYTVTREVIRGGTILIRGGKIEQVGQDIEVPEGATVIDASGAMPMKYCSWPFWTVSTEESLPAMIPARCVP